MNDVLICFKKRSPQEVVELKKSMWLPQGMKKQRMTWNHSGCTIFSRLAWKSGLTTPALKLSSQSPGASPSMPSGPCAETQLPEWGQKQCLHELQFGYVKPNQSLTQCKRKWQCEECGDQELIPVSVCSCLYQLLMFFSVLKCCCWAVTSEDSPSCSGQALWARKMGRAGQECLLLRSAC